MPAPASFTAAPARPMGRCGAVPTLDWQAADPKFTTDGILTNRGTGPKHEALAAYGDFAEVIQSVELAWLATAVVTLRARVVTMDADGPMFP